MENGGAYVPRNPGATRKKLAGYLKAANELRQTYQEAYVGGGRGGNSDNDNDGIPGAFRDGTVIRNGDEELLLFPSYARRHQSKKTDRHGRPGTGDDLRNEQWPGDAEYWKKEWEKYEDDNAIVDVDIRGWIYAPHHGQMSRKNRIIVGMARRLSGIPAPASSRTASPSSPHHTRMEARAIRHEDELAEKEAQKLEMKGQGEAEVALQGGYSESPTRANNQYSIADSPNLRRDPSPDTWEDIKPLKKQISNLSLRSVDKRASWNQPSEMSPEELSIANAHLMMRLKPFLTSPLVSTTITVFFYNDKESKSRTVTTNESGYFTYRAALDFVPTQVRVLASDKLSATEEVHITEPKGVSMISDIDDTIKHSAIGAGAREIFRNAFIRELEDLSIEGVKEWYQTLADMGVKLHYVSNSPWQFYPVLTSFFAAAGLPRGSFHLKQYTGMLQGIFEPVAERKKGTLDKIMADFPERRFILVGDSGEADLELYTDIMLANPGRILAVFIRDVTTSQSKSFFDSTPSTRDAQPLAPPPPSNDLSATTRSGPSIEKRPVLPPRPLTRSASTTTTSRAPPKPVEEDLISFDDQPPAQKINYSKTDPISKGPDSRTMKSPPPTRPSKPLSLRPTLTSNNTAPSSTAKPTIPRKPPPSPPPKPRQYSSSRATDTAPTDPSPLSQSTISSPLSSSEAPSYKDAVRNKVASAYNALPSFYASNIAGNASPIPHPTLTNQPNHPPIPPARRTLTTANPLAAADGQPSTNSSASNLSGGMQDSRGGFNDPANNPDNLDGSMTKKEELWIRRWDRAQGVFKDKGVLLRAWRVGEDVADECVRFVERALREERKP